MLYEVITAYNFAPGKNDDGVTLTVPQALINQVQPSRCEWLVPGDKIAIFSENRLGWAISDFGIQSAGGVTVPIYATNTGKQAAYILNHAEAKIVFCSTKKQSYNFV